MEHGVIYARASRDPLLHQEGDALKCRQGVETIIVVEGANYDSLLLTRAGWILFEF